MTSHTECPKWKAFLFPIVRAALYLAAVVAIMQGTAYSQVMLSADAFQSKTAAESSGWKTWCQRDEISPAFDVAESPSIGGAGSLMISGNSNSAAHGCWYNDVKNIRPGAYYRFEASYTYHTVPQERWRIYARLDWRGADGKRTGQPEYIPDGGMNEGWRHVSGIFRAPEGVASVRVELYLGWAPQGVVQWDGVRLEQVPDPGKRMVRVATVNCFPNGNSKPSESVEEFCRVADEAGRNKCDIVCLGEGVNLAGVRGAAYSDIAEPIPGPTTERLGEVARTRKMYIVAALGERDGHAIYNTAVLIDRQGKVAGKYRKAQLPREEIEAGVTPGIDFPVFETDFGKIGMMICWDNQYVEPARALAIQGAEIILMPIWGGNDILTQARAIENQVYVVSCGYSNKSAIYDPWGQLLAEAKTRPGTVWVDIDLNETHPEPWLGNMRNRFYREVRAEIPVPGLNE